MRISAKLTLSLTTIGLITFVGYGLYDLSIERQDLAQGISQQTQLFGRSLQIAIENAVRDKQIEDIEELLKSENHVKEGDIIINTASMPLKSQGRTNMLKIHVVG